MAIRSFLAFEKPDEIKGIIEEVSAALGKSRLDVRWVKAGNVHLTMVFLGNMQEEDLEAMEEPVQEICSTFTPFAVALKGLGCFPHTRNPRVIWIGLDGEIERMGRFRDDLQRRLIPFGIKEEKRAFRPHLTLGRFNSVRKTDRELEGFLERYRDLRSPLCTLGELVLFKSELRRGGSIYTRLKSWPLTGSQ
ncbi:MAG: RNA 2',3'-cyclic phosphodiesterase [Desulfobacteraceae bacterium]|nr:MAG: RNA 2',3'-cyclic phosphodiesterase [Desulfobacteraceae bacterium]